MPSGQHRNYHANRTKADNTFRIMCVGDSMTFGQGVLPNETLPAQLELLLNKSIWNSHIEVINSGMPGGTLYHVWSEFMAVGQYYNPDLVTLLLCDNDNCLTPAVGGSYEKHVELSWRKDGIFREYFVEMIQRVSDDAQAMNLPVLVVLYTTCNLGIPSLPIIIETMEESCAKANLPFYNLSKHFNGQYDGNINPAIKCSEEDGHPSAMAHSFAARFLAEELVKSFLTEKISEAKLPEEKILQMICSDTAQMQEIGTEGSAAWSRAKSILKSKHYSRHRSSLSKDKLLSDEKFQALIEESSQIIYQDAYNRLLESYQLELDKKSKDFSKAIGEIYGCLREAFSEMFCIRKNIFIGGNHFPFSKLNLPETPVQEYWGEVFGSKRNLESSLVALKNYIELLQPNEFAAEFESIAHGANLCRHAKRINKQSIEQILSEYVFIILRTVELIDEFERLVQKVGSKQSPPPTDVKQLNGIASLLVSSIRLTFATFSQLQLPLLFADTDFNISEPELTLKTTLHCDAEELPLLRIGFYSQIPRRTKIEETVWLKMDGSTWALTHKFPLATNVSIDLKLDNITNEGRNQIFEVLKMQLYVSESKKVELIGGTINLEDKKVVTFSDILVPL